MAAAVSSGVSGPPQAHPMPTQTRSTEPTHPSAIAGPPKPAYTNPTQFTQPHPAKRTQAVLQAHPSPPTQTQHSTPKPIHPSSPKPTQAVMRTHARTHTPTTTTPPKRRCRPTQAHPPTQTQHYPPKPTHPSPPQHCCRPSQNQIIPHDIVHPSHHVASSPANPIRFALEPFSCSCRRPLIRYCPPQPTS